jgi:hypothetical protein
VAAAIMGDASISSGSQKEHLVFKGVGAEWPAMAENDGLAITPILVINLCTVLRRNGCHVKSSFLEPVSL